MFFNDKQLLNQNFATYPVDKTIQYNTILNYNLLYVGVFLLIYFLEIVECFMINLSSFQVLKLYSSRNLRSILNAEKKSNFAIV